MSREFITSVRQTNEYYVMWAIESGFTQAFSIVNNINKNGIEISRAQVNGALQRLKKQGRVTYNCQWIKLR